jgi:hypothetical protein
MSVKNRTISLSLAKRSVGSSRFFAILTITIGCLATYFYAWFTAVPEYFGPAAAALGFQLGCWAFAWVLLVHYFPRGYPRISDPAVLVLLCSAIYFIYPSILWLQGQVFKDKSITIDTAVFIFWLHGLFILGFIFGHLIFRRSYRWVMPRLNIDNLPNGWLLYLVPFSIFLFWVVVHYVQYGSSAVLLESYANKWYELYTGVNRSRAEGGFSYILTQIESKTNFYVILIQGIGVGLIIIKMIHSRKYIWRNLFIFGTIFLITMFLGSGSRSTVIIVYLIGLLLADMINGPIPWRYLFILSFTGLVIFGYFGYFRASAYSGEKTFTVAYEGFIDRSVSIIDIPEFSSMFLKEAEGIKIFRANDNEGIYYIIRSVLMVIPSQVFPEKMQWDSTNDILSKEMEGVAYEEGHGMAGAIIVDGYRFAGGAGVPLLAFILGGILAVFHNVMNNYKRSTNQAGILIRIGLMAGFYSCFFDLIRGDLAGLIIKLVYYVIIPWEVINLIYIRRHNYSDRRKLLLLRN